MTWSTRRVARGIHPSWRIACAAALLSSTTGCASTKIPAWHGRLFFGDHAREGLTRNHPKDLDFISCRDPKDLTRYDRVVAMDVDDFKAFLDILPQCERWRDDGRRGHITLAIDDYLRLLMGRP